MPDTPEHQPPHSATDALMAAVGDPPALWVVVHYDPELTMYSATGPHTDEITAMHEAMAANDRAAREPRPHRPWATVVPVVGEQADATTERLAERDDLRVALQHLADTAGLGLHVSTTEELEARVRELAAGRRPGDRLTLPEPPPGTLLCVTWPAGSDTPSTEVQRGPDGWRYLYGGQPVGPPVRWAAVAMVAANNPVTVIRWGHSHG